MHDDAVVISSLSITDDIDHWHDSMIGLSPTISSEP